MARTSVGVPNALAERLLQAEMAALDLYVVYLGQRLGLYRALADAGPVTATELAERSGTSERYVREWLEHQAVAGFIDVEDASAPGADRRYSLPPDHVEVLVDRDSLSFSAHKAIEIVRASRRLPELVEAFRHGGGIPPLPWEPEGRADFNRPRFVNLLGRVWLPSIQEVHDRLTADPGFSGRYDLATIFEALHDMARPVEALRAARSLLAPGGWVLVADELVGEEFAVPAGDRERYNYGWSVVNCLPDAMGDPETAATGAVLRPAVLRAYALEAGFEEVEVLPIETEYWRFYRLTP